MGWMKKHIVYISFSFYAQPCHVSRWERVCGRWLMVYQWEKMVSINMWFFLCFSILQWKFPEKLIFFQTFVWYIRDTSTYVQWLLRVVLQNVIPNFSIWFLCRNSVGYLTLFLSHLILKLKTTKKKKLFFDIKNFQV